MYIYVYITQIEETSHERLQALGALAVSNGGAVIGLL